MINSSKSSGLGGSGGVVGNTTKKLAAEGDQEIFYGISPHNPPRPENFVPPPPLRLEKLLPPKKIFETPPPVAPTHDHV